jgi:GT2 family glycosyltransferase
MDLSIIIINYKSAALVLDCIESIYSQTRRYTFEIILVDNDSKDDCRQRVQAKYPEVRWLETGYNAGFARANNAGIEISRGKYILLLNADTIILDGAIDKSITLLSQHPDAVGCGVQLLNTDGSDQISGAHFVKGGLNTLLPLPYLGKLIRYLGYSLKTTVPSVTSVQDAVKVDWVVGAYMLVKKEVLAKSGLLDGDFFMYAEEIEWCSRLRKQGELYLFSEPKVIHIQGGTSSNYYDTKQAENLNSNNLWNKKAAQIIVSNILRVRKQFGVFWFLLIFSIYIFEVPLFFLCLVTEKIVKGRKAKYSFTNLKGYIKNIGILISHFFKMLFNRRFFYKVI